MRRAIITGVALVLALTISGLVVSALKKVRQAEMLIGCKNNLKQVGLGLQTYHDVHKHFPTGTSANTNLSPEKRFSWLSEICPAYIESAPRMLFDKNKSWDAEVNWPPRQEVRDSCDSPVVRGARVMGVIPMLVCPAILDEPDDSNPCTYYIGVSGVGNKAAEFPLENVNAGLFGYDRKVTLNDCKHGSETTIMLAEVLDGGPWTAGGRSTIRGLAPDKLPYFGPIGQFASNHVGGSNVVMADGAVRFFTITMSPRVIEAMATLQGDKEIARFED